MGAGRQRFGSALSALSMPKGEQAGLTKSSASEPLSPFGKNFSILKLTLLR